MRCDEVLTAALQEVSAAWTCRAVDNGWLLVTTSHQYSDGDLVELLVRRENGSVVVSDGGEALARLELAGVSVDHGRAREMWRHLLRAHELEVHAERLTVQGSLDEAGVLLINMANAVANIDGIRLMAAAPQSPRFADRLITFFQAEFEHTRESPQLQGRSGILYKATIAAGEPTKETFIQAIAGRSAHDRQRSVEHAFTIFSDVNGTVAPEQKLVVLGEGEWKSEQTKLLTIVANVGSWSYRDRMVRFVRNPSQRNAQILLPIQEKISPG